MKSTKASDIERFSEIAETILQNSIKNNTAEDVFYGKADYGYFVQVNCETYKENLSTSFNTDTKAGAKHFADMLSKKLNIPVKSDWDE